jgi:hypothetical protein
MKYLLAGMVVMVLVVTATGVRHKYRQPKRGRKHEDNVRGDTDDVDFFDFINRP